MMGAKTTHPGEVVAKGDLLIAGPFIFQVGTLTLS